MTERAFWVRGYHYLIVGFIVFFLGVKALWIGAAGVSEEFEIDQWKKVDATIQSLSIYPVFYRNVRSGDGIVATYSFDLDGKTIYANRVALDPTFGNSPTELLRAKKILSDAIEGEKTLPAFVDPANSANVVLFRTTPFYSYIFLFIGILSVFVSVPLAGAFVSLFSIDNKREERKQQYPEKPWKWEEYWQDFSIVSEAKWLKLLPLFVFSGIIFLVSVVGASLIVVHLKLSVEAYYAVAVVGLFNLLLAWYCFARWRGEAWADRVELVASAYPAIPGRGWKFKVLIENFRDLQVANGLNFYLQMNQPVPSIGMGSGRFYRKPWEFTDDPGCMLLNSDFEISGNNAVFHVEAKIPDTAENTELGVELERKWQVILFFKNSGKEFIETFNVPVYSGDKFRQIDENSRY